MNRNPNPKVIGAFITAAGILLTALVLFFGSFSAFRIFDRFILFFDQSVNGLNVGSPVKFRGVPIGSVERILIRAEGQRPSSTAIGVIVKINRERLEEDLGGAETLFRPRSTEESIRNGLVGQLSLESFITGQLFVEISVEPERTVGFKPHLETDGDMVEIPTLGSPLDQITDDVVQIVTEFSSIDLEELSGNVNRVLENLATALGGVDSEGISVSLTRAADTVSDFIGSEDFSGTLEDLRSTLAAIRTTTASYDLENGSMGERLDVWTGQLTQTLSSLDRLAQRADALIEPESDLRFEMEAALRELGAASRAIRSLAEYLERNPNALIRGREEE